MTLPRLTGLVVLAIVALPRICLAADDGLIARWTFDELEGDLALDASGSGYEALVKAATLTKGVSGGALRLDGTGSSIESSGAGAAVSAEALSLEAWVRPDTATFSGFPSVIRKDGFYALRFGNGTLGFLLWAEDQPVRVECPPRPWQPGHWYHLAGVYDGRRMVLYVDGEQVAAADAPAGITPLEVSPMACLLGGGPGRYPFTGTLDEVSIYSRALSAAEVAAANEAGRQSLVAQADLAFEDRPVGERPKPFRKPEREITMVQDGFLWIDAEDFTDYGGWSLDTQFVHLMGSAYLIATGVGTPVADATTSPSVPRAGSYRLWVRARNWDKRHSPGTFAVSVDGRQSERVLGAADSDEWLWEDAGQFELPAGQVRLALHDLTGYYGRCDALILTTDLSYTPPHEVTAIAQERSRLTGLSLEPEEVGSFDVIVVGAGAAGCCAALASARGGARTALIQNRPVLGGNAGDEAGVGINGAASSHPNARESGIIEEAGRVRARYGHPQMSEPFRILAEQEPNLSVFTNRHVFAVDMQDTETIAAVRAVDTLTGAITAYKGRMFIDCTGDGWVGFYAGAQYRRGREARSEFNESLAPEQADEITMSGCIMGGNSLSFRAADTGRPAPYVAPPWAPRFPSAEEFGRSIRYFTGGEWWLEHRGEIDDVYEAEAARDELIRITFGYWDYIKNTWPERERAANYALTSVPILDAKRESRRLVGDYVLSQNDVQSARVFPDRVAYGGWPLDVHHPEGIYSGKAGPFDCNPQVPIYTIPFRCLYSANIDNLLFAGRDMSVTHIALGSVRVQGTLAAMGQVVGTAAAMALSEGTTPRGLYEGHMPALQQRLVKDDLYIPGIVNEDPLDLARRAKVTASSTGGFDTFGKALVEPDDKHPLNTPRAVMLPTHGMERLGSIHLLLASELEAPAPVTLHLRGADAFADFSSTEDLATAEALVPPGQSWVEFRLDAAIGTAFTWVWLPAVEGLSWRLMTSAPKGCCRAYGVGSAGQTVVQGQFYAFYTDPELRVPLDFAPENVTNGTTRVVGDGSNLWASDPDRPLPQWLELDFGAPVTMNAVYLTFDTDMNAPYHSVPLPRPCVRDYELAYHDGAAWTTLAKVGGNFQRRRVHHFEAVSASRLRLTVTATNGHPAARVYEVRVYEE